MNEAQRLQLMQRNKRIIEAIKAKAQKVCPGAVDLIAVTGSFQSGDFYEKSDLDLLIIINSDAGYRISKCFILGDVAHDIYCHSWQRMEEMAEYNDPHVLKLIDVGIVYHSSEEALQRYNALREKLLGLLHRPLGWQTLGKIREHLNSALQAFGRLCLEDSLFSCRPLSAEFLYFIEFIVYMCNQAYIRHGIQGIPEEICGLKKLPENFRENYFALINAQNVSAIRQSAKLLLKGAHSLIEAAESEAPAKPPITAQALEGSYEEICSNWRNKVYRAAEKGDRYLALMSMASCQVFYQEMAERYDIPSFNLFTRFTPEDLQQAVQDFERVMQEYKTLYDRENTPVCRYDNIESFISDYLR